MKVLIATRATQGDDPGDYFFTVDGELVTASHLECANERCGCDRGFAGLASHRAATTAMVADLALDDAAFRDAVRSSLRDQGWLAHLTGREADRLVHAYVDTVGEICRAFPVGAVVRRKATQVWMGALVA